MRMVRLALVQCDSVPLDVDGNVERGRSWIARAAAEGADLVVFPEMFTSGYDLGSLPDNLDQVAEALDGPTIRTLGATAREHRVNVIAPVPTRTSIPGVFENTAVILDRAGEVAGTYAKSHLFEGERGLFRPGSEFPVFTLDFGRVGLMICYDAGFPEVARQLAFGGAELLVAPAAFRSHDKYMWDIYFGSRALENACFVAATNRVGTDGGVTFFGNNQLRAPDGSVTIDGPIGIEDMQLADIDLDEVAKARQVIPYLRDIRRYTY